MGFTADIIVWDLSTKQIHKKLCLHKVMVQAVDFSFDETKLVSLGGPDDASLVLWDVASGEAICGSPTNGKFLYTVQFMNQANNRMATAGQGVPHGELTSTSSPGLLLCQFECPSARHRATARNSSWLQRQPR
jgi:WD40 repeat protein